MKKFKGKFSTISMRKQWWDYASNAAYFVTINTKNRVPYFGKIIENNFTLFAAGKIATDCWLEIPNHFENVYLGEYIIMPDHMHGIVIISNEKTMEHETSLNENIIKSGHALILDLINPENNKNNLGETRFQNIGKKSLSSIIGSFKSAVKRKSNLNKIDFNWQTNFHEMIIKDYPSYCNIENYIKNNR